MISSTLLNALIALGGTVLVILAARDLITKKDENGKRKITKNGVIFICFASSLPIISIRKIQVTNSEKSTENKKADSTHKADKKQIKDIQDTLNSVQLGLKERNLIYDPKSGKIK